MKDITISDMIEMIEADPREYEEIIRSKERIIRKLILYYDFYIE